MKKKLSLFYFKRLVFTIILPLLFLQSALFSQNMANFSSAFVDIGFGARPLGMGQAFIAVAADADAVIWNPAGIVEVNGFAATVSYAKQFNLIPYSHGAVVYSLTPDFSVGGGIIVSGDDLMQETSVIVSTAKKISLNGHSLNLGIAAKLLNASFGKNNEPDLSVSGEAIGLSLGFGVQFYATESIVMASSLNNLFSTITWNSSTSGKYSEGLPGDWVLGIGLLNYHNFNVDLDFHKSLYKDIEDKFYIGSEYNLAGRLVLRAGAASSLNQSEKMFFSFGGGITHTFQNSFNFCLDAAYILHPLANMFRISLSFNIE